MDDLIMKKFYRDLSDEENDFLVEIVDKMRSNPIDVPPHVVARMIERELLPSNLSIIDGDDVNMHILTALPQYQEMVLALDDGRIYEVSNEAIGKDLNNPFRLVLAREAEDGNTYFVKIAPRKEATITRILDVWKRKGKIPIYPPIHALRYFVGEGGWDVIETLEEYFDTQEEHHPAMA